MYTLLGYIFNVRLACIHPVDVQIAGVLYRYRPNVLIFRPCSASEPTYETGPSPLAL